MLDYETWFEQNYDTIRYNFEQELMEQWYSSHLVSEVDDWWDEFTKEEYNIYLTNWL